MTSNQPPRIAAWLLRHFGCGPNNDVVIGDLEERYSRGRSPLWYWRQVLAAMLVSFIQEVWNHKLLTVRAIAVGWAIDVVSRHVFDVTAELLNALGSWWRFWRFDWMTIALQFPEIVLIGVFTGWLIARRNRQSQKAMVLVYATYFIVLHAAGFVGRFLTGMSFQGFIFGMSAMVATGVGILFGGGLFSGRRDSGGSERNWGAV
jgi:hypothetical protein